MFSKYFFFLFIIIFKISNNYIILPFNSDKSNIKKDILENKEELGFFLREDKLFTLLSFGNDIIEFYLNNNFFNFFLGNGLCRNNTLSTYQPSNSNYYNNITDFIYKIGYVVNASYSYDKCSIFNNIQLNENITINNLLFLYGVNTYIKEIINMDQICGYIGLQLEYKDIPYKENNFIKLLKQNNAISSYTWSIIFFNYSFDNYKNINENIRNKYEGFLICGVEEQDYKKIYSTEDIRTIKVKPRFGLIDWGMMFTEVYFDNKNKTEKSNYQSRVQIVFDIKLDYIISTKYFFDHLQKSVFKQFFEQKICFSDEIDGATFFIVCEKNFEEYIEDFPDLYFYHKELNYTFVLPNKDLFKIYNNRIYFSIISKVYVDYWTLGNIFLKKYPFSFDNDKKLISFINIYNKEIKREEGSFEKAKNKFKSFLSVIKNISIIIGILIGIFIGKKIWDKNRKKRANELIDSYQYESYLDRKEKKLELKDKQLFEN